ncbi:MAG: hypothetical protein IT320_10875 [Anaerolineae bacterium]|nr:hypothetical protein [Anaerolineae bacterium]
MIADMPPGNDFSDIHDIDSLRQQAITLYERCLTEDTLAPLIRFVDDQIIVNPPRTQLLRDVADDLHQRLVALQEQYFEARDRVLYLVRTRFDLDLSALISPSPETYHRLPIDELINTICLQKSLTAEEEGRLRRILKVSHGIATQVFNDALLTQELHSYINDWLTALNTQNARRQAGDDPLGKDKHIQ